jgi:Putative transposase/Transposase zinc-binding domain
MNSVPRQDVGVAEIFRLHGERFLNQYRQPAHNLKLIHLIKSCRTQALGGHMQKCDSCDFEKPMYNSCRCRMCPKCQVLKRERWVQARNNELLPCGYVHGVFTLPHELNLLASYNKELIYKLLFDSVSETLQTFAKRSLNGQLGFISVLHTWNQKIESHIHLHCIIPAGAFEKSHSKWIPALNDKFLFPVRALSKVFKAKFLALLRREKDKLTKPARLQDEASFNDYLNSVYNKEWVVYAKRPFNGPRQVIEYLGRYTHKTAISNSRIQSIDENEVVFKYRDRADGDTEKSMALDGVEFLRRFMLHALPKGFHRIRFYGFLSNVAKNKNIDEIYRCLQTTRPAAQDPTQITPESFFKRKFNIDIVKCPHCKQGQLSAYKPP